MCNLYSSAKSVEEVRRRFDGLQMRLTFPESIPNLQERDIAITDRGPIVRASANSSDEVELLVRRWSWPGFGGKPVYNFRSEGREFPNGRCIVIANGFYEFTNPTDPKRKRKDRWMFTAAEVGLIGIAGLLRVAPDVGECFTMLTTQPGPDIAPFHSRQVVTLRPADWRAWLEYSMPEKELLKPAPEGTFRVHLANQH